MKKKLLFAFVLFFSIASSDIGISQVRSRRVTLKDIYGNNYTFTNDSVFCGPDIGEFYKASGAYDDAGEDFFKLFYDDLLYKLPTIFFYIH